MDDQARPRPVPRAPSEDSSSPAEGYGSDASDAGGSEDQPSVVADVERSLLDMDDLGPEEQVEAYRDLETSLRETLRTAGEDS